MYQSLAYCLPKDKLFDLYPNSNTLKQQIQRGSSDKFVIERVDHIVRKAENAACQHFLLFSHCYRESSVSG